MLEARPRATTLLVGAAAAALVLASAVPAAAATTAGPAITLRGASSASSTSGDSVTVPKPAGTVAGDVLVARVANRGDVTASMTSAGWTPVGSTQSAALLKSVVLVRVATGGEPSSYTFDVSEPSNLAATVTAYDNVDNADPVDTFAGRVNGNLDLFTTPSVTSTVGNAMAVWFGTQLYTGTDCLVDAITPPSGLTEVLDDCLAPGGSGLAVETAQRQLGAPAVRSGWTGSSDFLRTNVTQVLTLRPASAVQTASRYASSSTDVGKLWEGYDLLGNRDTWLSDDTLHEPSGLAASRVNPGVAVRAQRVRRPGHGRGQHHERPRRRALRRGHPAAVGLGGHRHRPLPQRQLPLRRATSAAPTASPTRRRPSRSTGSPSPTWRPARPAAPSAATGSGSATPTPRTTPRR